MARKEQSNNVNVLKQFLGVLSNESAEKLEKVIREDRNENAKRSEKRMKRIVSELEK